MKCRHCKSELSINFLNLGNTPPSNSYIGNDDFYNSEMTYPLVVMVCGSCWLTQTLDFAKNTEYFNDNYAYFSSISKSWLNHAKNYVSQITSKLQLNEKSLVIEIASNDGYLLKNFVEDKIPCIGIEPTKSTANSAKKLGIPVIDEFFTNALAKRINEQVGKADLIIGNNVYAHVPDINDFTRGLKSLLKKGGTITLEFQHLLRLMQHHQFDTIYHEHYSYLSLFTIMKIFEKFDLKIIDVEHLPTHGGSLRIYGCHSSDSRKQSKNITQTLADEKSFGLKSRKAYEAFQDQAEAIKNNLLNFLLKEKARGSSVMAYGAAAKGSTLLNFAGIKKDLVSTIFDAAPSKIGKFMPGNKIPIKDPKLIRKLKPDYLLILPWNLSNEIMSECEYIKTWGGRFIIALPSIKKI